MSLESAIKELMARLDALHRNNADSDTRRYIALARTSFEQGMMWAEKAINHTGVYIPDEPDEPDEPEEEGDAEVADAEEQEKAAVQAGT